MRILCVDDALLVRQSLQHILQQEGYDVDLADGSDQALQFVKAHQYDFVISDINMPGLSGLDMIAVMQEGKLLDGKTDVLMLTTETSAEQRARGKSLGVKVWIVKPYQKESLLSALKVLTTRKAS